MHRAHFLEFHHLAPYAACCDVSTETIALQRRARNQYEAILDVGPDAGTGRRAHRHERV
jgi:hypothetical protein